MSQAQLRVVPASKVKRSMKSSPILVGLAAKTAAAFISKNGRTYGVLKAVAVAINGSPTQATYLLRKADYYTGDPYIWAQKISSNGYTPSKEVAESRHGNRITLEQEAKICAIAADCIINSGRLYNDFRVIKRATGVSSVTIYRVMSRYGYTTAGKRAWADNVKAGKLSLTSAPATEVKTSETKPSPQVDNQRTIVSAFSGVEGGLFDAAKRGILVAAHNLTNGQSPAEVAKFLNAMYSKLTFISEVAAATPESAPYIFE